MNTNWIRAALAVTFGTIISACSMVDPGTARREQFFSDLSKSPDMVRAVISGEAQTSLVPAAARASKDSNTVRIQGGAKPRVIPDSATP